jgi:hypothetical protein
VNLALRLLVFGVNAKRIAYFSTHKTLPNMHKNKS